MTALRQLARELRELNPEQLVAAGLHREDIDRLPAAIAYLIALPGGQEHGLVQRRDGDDRVAWDATVTGIYLGTDERAMLRRLARRSALRSTRNLYTAWPHPVGSRRCRWSTQPDGPASPASRCPGGPPSRPTTRRDPAPTRSRR